MLGLQQQKHLIYFDRQRKWFSSYLFKLNEKQEISDKKAKPQIHQSSQTIGLNDILKFNSAFLIQNQFTHKWESQFYDIKIQQSWNMMPKLHKIPLSLQTYFALYKNPKSWKISFVLKPKYTDLKISQKDFVSRVLKEGLGKLVITTNFTHVKINEPSKPPVLICRAKDLNIEAKKTIKIINLKDQDTIICSGRLVSEQTCEKVANFQLSLGQKNALDLKYRISTFEVSERVSSQNICILKHRLNEIQFEFNKLKIRIMAPGEPKFIPTLAKVLQGMKTMVEIQPIIIIQDVQSKIENAHRIVFYTDLQSLSSRIFRSHLYDKIEDAWLIEGMVHYTRSNKNFQDVMNELIDLMTDGEEFFPLADYQYYFDEVWKAKARFFFYVLANFKITRDYGSSSLVGLILEYSRRKKINSTYLFRRLKKKYGLDGSFRGTYQQQFVKCTGLNRIFYELIDIRRDNSVKYIIRQKSLLNKFFKTYNLFRIKLQHTYGQISPLMQKIIKKNRYEDQNRKKDLLGSLAVPQFLRSLPYFKGKMTVQSDACQPFQLQLLQQNMMQKTKQSSSLKSRPANRKPGQTDKGLDGFNWMMLDTAYVFPAVYKNQNVHQNVILQKIKKTYESQQQQIKVLNCISSRDHSQNQQICHALLQKLKMQPKGMNTTLSVKRKILQIISIFINKVKDPSIWQDYYQLFILYEPPCFDHSQDGFQFLLSLVESSTQLAFRKQFYFYFNELHRILLSVLLNHSSLNSQQKEIKLKTLLFKSLMKWKSKYSYEILKKIKDELQVIVLSVPSLIIMLKGIVQYGMKFLQLLSGNQYQNKIQSKDNAKYQLVQSVLALIKKCIQKDSTGQLYSIKMRFQLLNQEINLKTLDFLRSNFKKLQILEQQNHPAYWMCLKQFKNVLNQNQKKYGLNIQLDELNQDQNYFLAQYLWTRLQLKSTLSDTKIRLQWLKIYRIFYFYFTPIITIHKLRKNTQTKQFNLGQRQTQSILQSICEIDFIPDIKWLSGYDSSTSKQQKAKYEQYNLQNNRRKKRFEDLTFQQNNFITRYVIQNPGKDSWEDIARQALRTVIIIQEKKEVQNPEHAERYKKIVQGLKNVQNYLKRGNIPNDYSLQKVKIQAQYVLRLYDQETQKLEQIFVMVQRAVQSIKQQKRQKDLQKQNQMKIFIPKDYMAGKEDFGINDELEAIKEHPQQQGDEYQDQRIMRQQQIFYSQNQKRQQQGYEYDDIDDNKDEDINQNQYGSIFD